MLNDLGWNDLGDRRKHTHLTLFYKIVHHEINISSKMTQLYQQRKESGKGQGH